ncbi:MAG: hypothetical protein Q9157_005993, partial [Trypethelium eluteriae]
MALAKLLERVPDLPSAVERDKQARIDNIMMQAKYFEGDSRVSRSVKAGSADELQLPSLTPSSRRKSSKGVRSTDSPEIEGKVLPSDMLFEMEEEIMLPEASANDRSDRKGKAPLNENHQISTPLLKPHQDLWYDSKGKLLSSSQDIASSSLSPSVSPNLQKTLPASVSSSTSKAQGVPWGASPLPSSKLDLKEIMDQASTSRISNISLGLSFQSKQQPQDKAAAQPGTRVSQKDRKKMRQTHQSPELPTASPDPLPSEAKRSAPWQIATRGPKIALKDVIGEEAEVSPSRPGPPPAQRNPSAPQLTMRQTVANPAMTANSRKSSNDQLTHPQTPQQRSVSSPQAPEKLMSKSPATPQNSKTPPSRTVSTPASVPASSSPSAPPPSIRSITHLQNPLSAGARAAEPSLGLSMAEIVLQQQAEKDTIREASTAKRSLQEIQQEQEFQEWWDKESRK